MPVPFRVALLGFSDFERSTLASYFRLAARRNPSYELVQLVLEPDFMIADADHGPSVQLVLAAERLGQTVFIGSEAPTGALAWMQRPIDPLHVMRELDAMVAQNRPADAPQAATAAALPSAPATTVSGQRTVIQAARRSRRSANPPKSPEPAHQAPAELEAEAPSPPTAPPDAAEDSPPLTLRDVAPVAQASAATPPAPPRPAARAPVPPAPAPAPPAAPLNNTLVVDDSELARHFLARQLEPWGLRCDFADGSKRALELLARQAYEFVFLDIELGEGSDLDGLALCQRIKRQLAPTPGVLATVVLVSAHQSELDRVRGSLAGCDAYLGKPLVPADLQRLLRRHGLALPAQASPGA